MPNTIFYKGKIKRGRKPVEVFEKIQKGIKKKGPTKDWVCSMDEEQLRITFPDGSEDFVLKCNAKGEFDDFCKVYFLDKESEEGENEFHALIDAIYNAKSMFSKFEIHDDFGLAESYWDSKRFKIHLRELTAVEKERVTRLFQAGYTTHEQLLLAIMAEDMEMSVDELRGYVNIDIGFNDSTCWPPIMFTLESYLYETAAFGKEGRLCELPDWQYYDLGKVSFSVFAFIEGLAWVFCDGSGYHEGFVLAKKNSFSQKDAQVGLLFREKFAPAFLKSEDALERCLLAYQYFVSVYDFLGFQFAGHAKVKLVMDEILEEYGEEKGSIFLTAYCTSERYMFSNHNKEQKEAYGNCFVKNMIERYGRPVLDEYLDFKRKYQQNTKFRQETGYIANKKVKYIDDSLVL